MLSTVPLLYYFIFFSTSLGRRSYNHVIRFNLFTVSSSNCPFSILQVQFPPSVDGTLILALPSRFSKSCIGVTQRLALLLIASRMKSHARSSSSRRCAFIYSFICAVIPISCCIVVMSTRIHNTILRVIVRKIC